MVTQKCESGRGLAAKGHEKTFSDVGNAVYHDCLLLLKLIDLFMP